MNAIVPIAYEEKPKTLTADYFEQWDSLGLKPIPLIWDPVEKKPSRYPEYVSDVQSGHDINDVKRWINGKVINAVAFKLHSPWFMLDFDLKNTGDKNIYKKWLTSVGVVNEDVISKLCIERTRNGGIHVYGKFAGVTGKKRLAGGEKNEEVIALYTGGLLSYAYPTPGYFPVYNEMQDVSDLTHDEFDLLISMAMVYDLHTGSDYTPSEVTDYPAEFKAIATRFDLECSDDNFESLINAYNLYPTGKTGTIRKTGVTYYKYLREGSSAEFSAKVFFDKKRVYIFSGSYTDVPTFHTRKDDHDGSWRLTPSLLLYYKTRDWQKMVESIKGYLPVASSPGMLVCQYCGFWTNDFKNTNIQLSTGELRNYLIKEGFCILDGQYVQVINGVIYKRDKTFLYDTIINAASKHEVSFSIKNKDGGQIVFTADRKTLETKAQKEFRGNVGLIALPEFNYEIMRDSADQIFLHFRDKSICVKSSSWEIANRSEKVIWSEQLIDFDISDRLPGVSVFADFLVNISGGNLSSFRSGIGYSLRNYNGSNGLRVVWLCDEQYETGKQNGRTGKSLLWKAISKLRKTDEVSGKDFNQENPFKFQNISRDTQLFVIDDVKQNFDFRSMYNYCTEGVEFSKKHKDRIKLPVKETPQLVITSNYPPHIEEGASTTGRLFILPLTTFYITYTDKGGVKAYHGHIFFDDWDDHEWNMFYWLMIDCAREFLELGLVPAKMDEVRKNRLRTICAGKFKSDELTDDFVDWIYGYQMPDKFELETLIADFRTGDIDKKIFAECLKAFLELEGWSYIKKREQIEGKRATIWRVKK